MGNTSSNLQYNPRNTKPPIPIDADEVDSAMERFIRQKYEQKAYVAGAAPPAPSPAISMHTGGTGSSDDHPPPPPPKPGRRFGFGLRSSSSAFPLGRSSGSSDGPKKGASISPIKINKSSKVIGASIGVTENDQGLEWKLLQLREMGFPDDQKNTNILKGLNGDLERTIESLVRLGEGAGSGTVRTPQSSQIPSRQHTPNPPFSAGARIVSAQSTPSQLSQRSPPVSARSTNPFDIPNPVPAPQQSLENAFSSMNMASQPPLFPNATGPQHIIQMQAAQTAPQQSIASPVQQNPQLFMNYNNPYAQQQQQGFNPFQPLQQQNLPSPASSNPHFPQQQNTPTPNPFMNQQNVGGAVLPPFQGQSTPKAEQQPQTPQTWVQIPQSIQQQQFLQSPTQLMSPQSYMVAQPSLSAQQSPFGPLSPLNLHSPYQQLQQPMSAQSTGRIDKSSILALYNYPQLAPAPETPSSQTTSQSSAGLSPQHQAAQLPPGVSSAPQRSVTMPVPASGNRNPFLPAGGSQPAPTAQPAGPWHASRESSESGRHSPDAFASLSARSVR